MVLFFFFLCSIRFNTEGLKEKRLMELQAYLRVDFHIFKKCYRQELQFHPSSITLSLVRYFDCKKMQILNYL